MSLQTDIIDLLPSLRRFAFSLTNSRADAEDLVQTTVERLLSKPVPAQTELAKWAFRVCRNIWIDEYRARKVRQLAALNPELQQEAKVQGEYESAASLAHVGNAMQQLPTEQHEVLSLIAVKGCSYKEAAEILETPVGTVMSRLSRARAALVELMRDNEGASPKGFH